MYACAKVLYYAQKQPVNKGWGAGERERERDKDLEKDEREKRRKKGKKGLLYFTKTDPLINAWNQLPFHPSTVLFPILPILSQTPRVIPHASLKQ